MLTECPHIVPDLLSLVVSEIWPVRDDNLQEENFPGCSIFACAGYADHYFSQVENLIVQLGPDLGHGLFLDFVTLSTSSSSTIGLSASPAGTPLSA